ncbi:MAG: hypothetical protein H0T97_08870, partial [Actinobacteria bacterium]|nr:hypothetical protein [Actinomycetota bacterium]
MRRLIPILVAALAASIAAPVALGESFPVKTVDLVSGDTRQPVSAGRFTLAGIHWRGPGRVAFRTRSLEGRWSAWRPAAPEDEKLNAVVVVLDTPGGL